MLLFNHSKYKLECGTDEAGRGCLAGPVTAAAVILPDNFKNSILNDSKQLSKKKRFILKPIIEEQAITYGVAHVFQEEIDTVNILNASILAMHHSIDKLLKTRKDQFFGKKELDLAMPIIAKASLPSIGPTNLISTALMILLECRFGGVSYYKILSL